MRKIKRFLVSVSMAAALLAAGLNVCAEETETAAEVTEVVETTAAAADESGLLESDRTALESYAEESIKLIVAMTDEQAEEVLRPSSVLRVTQESIVTSVESWLSVKEELGAFEEVLSHEITVDDDAITIASNCKFANSESVVSTTLNRDDLSMESVTFAGASKGLGETMKEAALNTLMGIGIVFLMLAFLSFLISRFKYISKLEESFKKKNEAPAPAPVAAAPVAAPVVEETVDDGELIAVIAAAIAAAEGTSTDGFVVRSIRKSNRNKWQRA